MELKATSMGQHLARHPYTQARLLRAGIEVSGPGHNYTLPFSKLLAIRCKRGVIWGELEFELPEEKVIRLHGTEWKETQLFYQSAMQSWQDWSGEMSRLTLSILQELQQELYDKIDNIGWFAKEELGIIVQLIQTVYQTLPFPWQRLPFFENCHEYYRWFNEWLEEGEKLRVKYNQQWCMQQFKQHNAFFNSLEEFQLTERQGEIVLMNERAVVVAGRAWSGKSTILKARISWLLHTQAYFAEEILLLTAEKKGVADKYVEYASCAVKQRGLIELALDIIQQSSKKTIEITPLEFDVRRKQQLLLNIWQENCKEKVSQRNGWYRWLTETFNWQLSKEQFWLDDRVVDYFTEHLPGWLELLIMDEENIPDALLYLDGPQKELLEHRKKLLTPLLRGWKAYLKNDNSVDIDTVFRQALILIHKKKFIPSWKCVFIDDFHALPITGLKLLNALFSDVSESLNLFVTVDSALLHDSFTEIVDSVEIMTAGNSESVFLPQYHHPQQQLIQLAEGILHSDRELIRQGSSGGRNSPIVILPLAQLDPLLDKLSSFVSPEQQILILSRYSFLETTHLKHAKTRWPGLQLSCSLLWEWNGEYVDYIVILDHRHEWDTAELGGASSALFQEEKRRLYSIFTKARNKVWWLCESEGTSTLLHQMKEQGIVSCKRP